MKILITIDRDLQYVTATNSEYNEDTTLYKKSKFFMSHFCETMSS